MLKRLRALRHSFQDRRRYETQIAELERINAAEVACGDLGLESITPSTGLEARPEPSKPRM